MFVCSLKSFPHDRRGEEHSFILKPATTMWKKLKAHGERSSQSSQLRAGNAASSLRVLPKTVEGKRSASTADQYAIMVSCRCNYTGIYIALSLPYYLKNISSYLLLIITMFIPWFLLCVESRLFFKQPTNWRPRMSRDLMISVASEISGQSPGPNEGVSQLPVQVSYELIIHLSVCRYHISTHATT